MKSSSKARGALIGEYSTAGGGATGYLSCTLKPSEKE